MSPQQPIYRNAENFEPGMMYHPQGGAKHVSTPEQKAAAIAEGFHDRYMHQEYPKVMKHDKKKKRLVVTSKQHLADLTKEHGEGWTDVGYEPPAEPEADAQDAQAAKLEELSTQMETFQAMAVENAKLREQLAAAQAKK